MILPGPERRQAAMRILKAGGLYFALVFAAGFVLGTLRVLWIVPRLGARTAELTVVLALRGLTLREYLASRDPVAGSVYVIMLGIFAVMPLFVARR
ncbi:MAG TPA: hypothetical protein VMV34_01325 [Terriglobia bacterium]|nr:hypothetical protein [Terriglobia bacterium]